MFWKENATKLNDKDYEQLKYIFRLFTMLGAENHFSGHSSSYYKVQKSRLCLLWQRMMSANMSNTMSGARSLSTFSIFQSQDIHI